MIFSFKNTVDDTVIELHENEGGSFTVVFYQTDGQGQTRRDETRETFDTIGQARDAYLLRVAGEFSALYDIEG